VKADQISDATPCTEFDVRGLLNHMIVGLEMLTTAASGGKAEAPGAGTDRVGDGSAVGAAYDERRAKLLEVIKQNGVFDKTWEMPFGQMPGKMMAGIAFMEHLTHAWDVKKATGQDSELPADLVAECAAVVTPMDAMLRMPGVCGPAVEAPDGASETDKLMAFLGRTP
jgi:uncharacterized protein (TIGR03086 family)